MPDLVEQKLKRCTRCLTANLVTIAFKIELLGEGS
jgi:hypothetical protein